MKKLILFLFCFLVVAGLIFGMEINLLFYGGLAGSPSISDSNYDFNGSLQHISVSHNGTISSEANSSFAGGLGAEAFFSENIGVRLTGSFWSNNIKTKSNYNLSWTWETGVTGSDGGSWNDTGKISIKTFNLDLVYKLNLPKQIIMELSGGPSIVRYKADLNSYGGGFYVLVNDYVWGWEGWIDWFKYKINVNASETVLGGNIGANFIKKINPKFSLFLAFRYYAVGKKTYEWLIVPGYYESQNGIFNRNFPSPVETDTTVNINFSNFTVVAGAKVHLR